MTSCILPDLVDITEMSDEEAYDHGYELYKELFLNQSDKRGEIISHDGMPVIFWADRYDHAFMTSSDRVRRPYDKDVVARRRISRIHWISKLISCDTLGVLCKEMAPPDRWQRAYYTLEHGHIVWLEPSGLKQGKPTAWRFSSAYDVPAVEIKRSTGKGKIIKMGAP